MDIDEFLKLIAQHERLIYSICGTFAKGDREAMRDLYQEIMYSLWRSREHYRGDCSPKNWLCRVALNTAISLWRKDSVRPKLIPLPQEMEQWLTEENHTGMYDELYGLIDLLPKAEQALLFLYLDGASEKDMSEALGISTTAVGVRIHRIKKKLVNLKS